MAAPDATASQLFGDQFYFWLGRHFGSGCSIVTRAGAMASMRRCIGLNATMRVHSVVPIYGIRNISSFAMGLVQSLGPVRQLTSRPPVRRQALSQLFFLGQAFNAVLSDIARSFSLVMLGVFVALGAGVWLLHRFQRRRQLRVPPGAKAVLPPP
jgi:membrane protein DedA with SNARE-associated domain